jgi:hypothetical protein
MICEPSATPTSDDIARRDALARAELLLQSAVEGLAVLDRALAAQEDEVVGVHELAEELIVRVCDRDVQIEEQEERIAAMEAEHSECVGALRDALAAAGAEAAVGDAAAPADERTALVPFAGPAAAGGGALVRPPLARALELYLCPISSKMALVGFAGGSVLADLLFNDGLRAFSGAGVLGALVAVAALAPPGK